MIPIRGWNKNTEKNRRQVDGQHHGNQQNRPNNAGMDLSSTNKAINRRYHCAGVDLAHTPPPMPVKFTPLNRGFTHGSEG